MLFPQEHRDSSKSPSLRPAGPQGKNEKRLQYMNKVSLVLDVM